MTSSNNCSDKKQTNRRSVTQTTTLQAQWNYDTVAQYTPQPLSLTFKFLITNKLNSSQKSDISNAFGKSRTKPSTSTIVITPNGHKTLCSSDILNAADGITPGWRRLPIPQVQYKDDYWLFNYNIYKIKRKKSKFLTTGNFIFIFILVISYIVHKT